jgi:hypothetical protein
MAGSLLLFLAAMGLPNPAVDGVSVLVRQFLPSLHFRPGPSAAFADFVRIEFAVIYAGAFDLQFTHWPSAPLRYP